MSCTDHRHGTSCLHTALAGCGHAGPALSRRGFGKALLGSAGAAAVAACTTNPVTGRSSFGTIQDDVSVGRQEHPKILQAFGGEYGDQQLASYIQNLGQSIAARTEFPNLPWRFTVLNSPIVNAMALPGGYIYITRGLLALASNEAEVAGVLSHEIGHVTARHSAARQTQSIFTQLGLVLVGVATGSAPLVDLASTGAAVYLQSYSRDQEFEADTLAVRYMSAGGWDPQAMATFLASLREQSQLEALKAGRDPSAVDQFNMMASHPRTIDRVQRAVEAAGAAAAGEGAVNRDAYLQEIDGILYGDDPSQGIVDGNWFRHPALRFEFRVPEGFQLMNGETEVVAQHPNGGGIVFDMAQSQSGDLAAFLRQWAGDAQLNDAQRITVNGLPAVTAWTRLQGSSGGQADVRLVAIQAEGNRVYRFLFIQPAGSNRWTEAYQQTTYSFRRLSAAEAQQVRAFRLYVRPVGSGDTIQTFARMMPFGQFNEQTFRVLNDLVTGGGLQPGELVKVVRTASA